MARRAHLDAFLWGGTIAWVMFMPLIAPPLIVPGFQYQIIENWADSSTHAFSLGAATVIAITLLGYTICWGIWWLRKR
jgi:hypothetical protein